MTTTKILLTVGTAWSSPTEKCNENHKSFINASDKQYVEARALQEIRETPAIKEQSLQHLRDWISKNPDIENVRTDDSFLLRFLRLKKYSIPMAQQTLLKYLNLRKYYPEMTRQLDCEDTKLKDILNQGYIVISPIRDQQGRRVIIYNMGKFDAKKYGCWEMCRANYLIYESLLEDETNQILGFNHVGDGNGVNSSHITAWNPIDFARIMKWGEQSIPMRHKEFNIFNIPSAVKYVVDFACSKVSPKMSSRLQVHDSLKSLRRKVDVSCLPKMYGGSKTLEEMIEYTRAVLSEQRPKVLALENMEIISIRGIISSKTKPTESKSDDSAIQGSFRKLEID